MLVIRLLHVFCAGYQKVLTPAEKWVTIHMTPLRPIHMPGLDEKNADLQAFHHLNRRFLTFLQKMQDFFVSIGEKRRFWMKFLYFLIFYIIGTI